MCPPDRLDGPKPFIPFPTSPKEGKQTSKGTKAHLPTSEESRPCPTVTQAETSNQPITPLAIQQSQTVGRPRTHARPAGKNGGERRSAHLPSPSPNSGVCRTGALAVHPNGRRPAQATQGRGSSLVNGRGQPPGTQTPKFIREIVPPTTRPQHIPPARSHRDRTVGPGRPRTDWSGWCKLVRLWDDFWVGLAWSSSSLAFLSEVPSCCNSFPWSQRRARPGL
jgi:hypothetical protein